MRPVFARTRYLYDSYTDYWRLVELSGFETCWLDRADLTDPDAVYIVSPMNGEFRPHIKAHGAGKRCKVVWWNLERPDAAGCPALNEALDSVCPYVDAVWVSDRHYASMDQRQRFIVLGSHPGLGNAPLPQSYDFTHQSYVVGRRVPVITMLRERLKEGPSGWGSVRDQVLRTSRSMVNIHQSPALVGEPLRIALAAAYRMPLITETITDAFPLVEGVDFLSTPIDELYNLVTRSVQDQDTCNRIGEALYQRLCVEWSFRRGVESGMRQFT